MWGGLLALFLPFLFPPYAKAHRSAGTWKNTGREAP